MSSLTARDTSPPRPFPRLPPDLYSLIINELADLDRLSYSTLKSCSLVCRAFVPLCQKYIFSKITLVFMYFQGDKSLTSHIRLLEIISARPTIVDYVREVDVTYRAPPGFSQVFMQTVAGINPEAVILKRLTSVRSFNLKYSLNIPLHWPDVIAELKSAFFAVARLSSIRSITLSHVYWIPTSFFQSLKNVKTLSISDASFDLTHGINPLRPGMDAPLTADRKKIKLSALSIQMSWAPIPIELFDGPPSVFDVRNLGELTCMGTYQDFSKVSRLCGAYLRTLELVPNSSIVNDYNLEQMNALTTLVLRIGIQSVTEMRPVIAGAAHVIKSLPTWDVLETFEIKFIHNPKFVDFLPLNEGAGSDLELVIFGLRNLRKFSVRCISTEPMLLSRVLKLIRSVKACFPHSLRKGILSVTVENAVGYP